MGTPRSASVRRLGQILTQAGLPVFVLDAESRVIYANPAMEPLTGVAAADLVGLLCQPSGPANAACSEVENHALALGSSLAPPAEALQGQPASARTLIHDRQGGGHWRRIEFWPLDDRPVEERPAPALLGLVRSLEQPAHAEESPTHRLRADLAALREREAKRKGPSILLGDGPAHRRLLAQVALAASRTMPGWIVAEPGSGLRHLAGRIHEDGATSSAPLVVLDAEALPPDRLEIALIGPRETPAWHYAVPGATVLLKNADHLARDVQARLVRAVDRPLSDPPSIRLLAASSGDPEAARASGRLRDDLYFALTRLVIRIPPLRERLHELPVLALHFLEQVEAPGDGSPRPRGFTEAALDVLRAYDWPGNLSELSRVVAAASRSAGDLVDTGDLPMTIRGEWAAPYPPSITISAAGGADLDATLELVERRLIELELRQSRQNKSRAAERLGISRPRLYRRMKELNIDDLPEGQAVESSQ